MTDIAAHAFALSAEEQETSGSRASSGRSRVLDEDEMVSTWRPSGWR